MFIDLESLKAAEHLFRDYDREWQFIKAMDQMGECKFDNAICVIRGDMELVGANWIFVYVAENDNSLGVI